MFIKLILILLIFKFAMAENLSVGFIYINSQQVKKNQYLLSKFDWLGVDPDDFDIHELKNTFKHKRNTKVIAYVSVGEVEPYRKYYRNVDKRWIIGYNRGWKSWIADVRDRDYINFLFENVFNKLSDYDGFILDTLDSYESVLKDGKSRKDYEDGLVHIIERLRNLYPSKIIIINRGFSIVDRVKDKIDAFLFEGLFYGLNTEDKIVYTKIDREETDFYIAQLNRIRNLGLKVMVIDYIPAKDTQLRYKVARKIWNLGFIPYISDKNLSTIGLSYADLHK